MSDPPKKIVVPINIDYEISQIKIMLDFGDETAPVPFVSSMLELPNADNKPTKLSEYPYFTSIVEYPIDILHELNYSDRINFFFNKAFFEKKMGEVGGINKIYERRQQKIETIKTELDRKIQQESKRLDEHNARLKELNALSVKSADILDKINDLKNRSIPYRTKRIVDFKNELGENVNGIKMNKEIIQNNILITLNMLFPTKYPNPVNISSSFDTYIQQGTTIIPQSTSFQLSEPQFSYIKNGGEMSTITNVVWLNDIINHPIYRNFIDNFLKYISSSKKESEKLQKTIDDKSNNLIKRLSTETPNKNQKNLKILDADIDKLRKNIKIIDTSKRQQIIFDNKREELNRDIIEIGNNLLFLNAALAAGITKSTDPTQNITIKTPFTDQIESTEITKRISFDDLFDIVSDINKRYKHISNQIPVNSEFDKKIYEIANEMNQIRILKTIYDRYIGKGSININIENEDKDIIEYLDRNFLTYVQFTKEIKNYLKPNRESSNRELQKLISNFANNNESSDSDTLYDIIVQIQSKYINSNPTSEFGSDKETKYVYSGISVVETDKASVPHIEIYVLMDTIKGKMTDEMVNQVDCLYKSMLIGSKTENLFSSQNKYLAKNNIIDFSIKDIEAKMNNNVVSNKKIAVSGGRRARKTTEKKRRIHRHKRSRRSTKHM
jgi:hypothetical protein